MPLPHARVGVQKRIVLLELKHVFFLLFFFLYIQTQLIIFLLIVEEIGICTWIQRSGPAADDVLGVSVLVHVYMFYTFGMRSPLALLRLALDIRRVNPDVLVYLMPPRSPRAVRRDKLFFRWAGGIRRIVGVPAQDESPRSVNPVTGLFESEATRLARTLAVLGDAGTPDLAKWSLRLTS